MRFPNTTRRALLTVAALTLAVALPARAADLLDTVKARGTLRVALEGTYPPFNFKDAKTGQLAGYDVDVAKLVCAKLGVKPEFVTTEWAAILAGLGAGEVEHMLRAIAAIRKQGVAIVIIEHTMHAMVRLADRLVVLDHGEANATGEPATVIELPHVIEAYLGKKWAARAAA